MNISQVMIFVDDIHDAKRFYVETLGLTIERDFSKEHSMIKIANAGCILTIHGGFPKKPFSGERKIVVAFAVDEISRGVAALISKGVQLVDGIEETPVHWFQAFLDPSGNMLEIAQYKNLTQKKSTKNCQNKSGE